MSSVPSPRVRKPKPRERLNHFTITISNPPTEVAWARVRAGTRRRSVVRFRLGNREHLEHLKPALAPRRLGDDPCAFSDRREAVPAQNGDVDEDVRFPAVRHQEPVTFRRIEPLDPSGDFDEAGGAVFQRLGASRGRQRLREFLAQFGPQTRRVGGATHRLGPHEPRDRRPPAEAEIRNASDSHARR